MTYPRVAVRVARPLELEPGTLAAYAVNGVGLGLVKVLAVECVDDGEPGTVILELGADCAPRLRELLLPPGLR